MRAYYYTTIMEGNKFQAMRPLTDWLDFNGFAVKSKPAKEYDDGLGRRKIKRNIGVELSIDALEISSTSITFCCSPATATSVAWSKHSTPRARCYGRVQHPHETSDDRKRSQAAGR